MDSPCPEKDLTPPPELVCDEEEDDPPETLFDWLTEPPSPVIDWLESPSLSVSPWIVLTLVLGASWWLGVANPRVPNRCSVIASAAAGRDDEHHPEDRDYKTR